MQVKACNSLKQHKFSTLRNQGAFLLLIKERFDTMRKRILAIVLMVVMIATTVLVTVGCTEATQVSYNVSQEADNFNVIRRKQTISM